MTRALPLLCALAILAIVAVVKTWAPRVSWERTMVLR